ncbi:MAG: KH domain-containing protein [Verrucomicrobia bacterium]|nr:KH domain-containing protein [Verrucomicrobiota bacterium]
MPQDPKTVLQTLLEHLGFPSTIESFEEDGSPTLNIVSDDAGRLIGRQGQTLNDLQYLLNRMLLQQHSEAPKVLVDAGGYRRQARDAMVEKARAAAEKVKRWGDIVELEPMNAFERRIIHHALRDDPTVETYSVEVEGTSKKAILLRPRRA